MVPQSRTPVILLTRPMAQSVRFAAELVSRLGEIRIVIAPLIAPRHLPVTLPRQSWTALVLTSETAAQSAKRITADGMTLPPLAFCVGDRTADEARIAGFSAVSAAGDAEALVSLIRSRNVVGPLLHLRGADSRGDVANRLNSAGIVTHDAVCYVQEDQRLSAEAVALLKEADPVIAPVFSPRTAEILVQECDRIGRRAPVVIVAMSPAVAIAALPLAADPVISEQPDAASMLDAIASLPDMVRKP